MTCHLSKLKCLPQCLVSPRFFDTSKQAIGSLFIHFANVFLSTLTKNDPCSLWVPVSVNAAGDQAELWLILLFWKVSDELPVGRHAGDAGHLGGCETGVQTGGIQTVEPPRLRRIWWVCFHNPPHGGAAGAPEVRRDQSWKRFPVHSSPVLSGHFWLHSQFIFVQNQKRFSLK